MAVVKWNQDVNAGQDWMADINLLLKDGNNRDITKHTLAGQIKRHFKSVNVKENITIQVMDPVTGNIRLMLSSTQTTNLKFGKWLYDVELTNSTTGAVDRVIEGIFNVRPEVTIS